MPDKAEQGWGSDAVMPASMQRDVQAEGGHSGWTMVSGVDGSEI